MGLPEILPLSALPPQLLIDYLDARGVPSAVTRWKYLDERYNRGRERGYGAVVDGTMAGFIGVIPVTLSWGDKLRQDYWLCDWSIANPVRDKGLGGAIAAEALKRSGRMIAFGGTDMAVHRWRQKADRYDLGSSPWFRKRLTTGSYVSSLQARGLLPRNKMLDVLGSLPLGRAGRPEQAVRITTGVHLSVPDSQPLGREAWRPRYDLADLRWQLEDCPEVEAWTCRSEDGRAATLVWHSKGPSGLWKIAPIAGKGNIAALSASIAGALRLVAEFRGNEVLAMISRLDDDLAAALDANGFKRATTVHPIFFMDTVKDDAPPYLEGTSFLDTDEGYRF